MGRVKGAVQRDHTAIRVETRPDIGYPGWRDTRPHHVLLQGPLDAHRFAGQLRENYCIAFCAIAAERRASVLTGMIQPANHDLLRCGSQHVRDARTQALRLRRVRPHGRTAIPPNVSDTSERPDPPVPPITL